MRKMKATDGIGKSVVEVACLEFLAKELDLFNDHSIFVRHLAANEAQYNAYFFGSRSKKGQPSPLEQLMWLERTIRTVRICLISPPTVSKNSIESSEENGESAKLAGNLTNKNTENFRAKSADLLNGLQTNPIPSFKTLTLRKQSEEKEFVVEDQQYQNRSLPIENNSDLAEIATDQAKKLSKAHSDEFGLETGSTTNSSTKQPDIGRNIREKGQNLSSPNEIIKPNVKESHDRNNYRETEEIFASVKKQQLHKYARSVEESSSRELLTQQSLPADLSTVVSSSRLRIYNPAKDKRRASLNELDSLEVRLLALQHMKRGKRTQKRLNVSSLCLVHFSQLLLEFHYSLFN